MVEKRPAEADASAVAPKEEDFPRGGGGALTALERRQAREEGKSRAEREADDGSRPSKKRKSSKGIEVHLFNSLFANFGVDVCEIACS